MTISADLIDVSSAQAPSSIVWPRVKAAGIMAVYARAGHGPVPDPTCRHHLAGAEAVGLSRGVYWYWEPEANPEKQAEDLVAGHVGGGCELAPVVDVEDDGSPRHHQVPRAELPALLMRFLLRADAHLSAGVRTAIYTGPGFWKAHFAADAGWAFRNRMLWVAHYGVSGPDVPWPWDEHALWQYAANTIWSDGSFGTKPKTPGAHVVAQPGIVDGVQGEVDCNALGNASLQDLIEGTQPATPLDYADVSCRQRACRRQGCDPGSIDGQWGPHSRAALVLLQHKLGLHENGVWSAEVEEAIADITKK